MSDRTSPRQGNKKDKSWGKDAIRNRHSLSEGRKSYSAVKFSKRSVLKKELLKEWKTA